MELKYVLLTLIKILISVPKVLMAPSSATLMGGHLDNHNQTEIKLKEAVPDPSALVVPGYNLPENIFNKGKPFYLEKDPVTGHVDFESKSKEDLAKIDEYDEYYQNDDTFDIYNKANIDRKDGSLSERHKPSDVNQLTPNFHDFLNLPVKYNSEKYVYPLISSSYANTKIQGNVNRFHNHKDYVVKQSTVKNNPMYYTSTSTATSTTTTEETLMNNAMSGTNNFEEYEYYDEENTNAEKQHSTPKPAISSTASTTTLSTPVTTKTTTTTKRPMSLFEQLFGDYDETVAVTERTRPPPLFQNLPSNKNKYFTTISSSTTSTTPQSIIKSEPNHYEYEDYAAETEPETITTTTTSKPISSTITTHSSTTSSTTTTTPEISITPKLVSSEKLPVNPTEDYGDYDYLDTTKFSSTSTKTHTDTTTASNFKVTSLPIGENHISTPHKIFDEHQHQHQYHTDHHQYQPEQPLNPSIIVATHNLREQLNGERIAPRPFEQKPPPQPPSTSNIHIAPDQDTVSFIVGHHQNVEEGTGNPERNEQSSPYESNPFRPLYETELSPNLSSSKDDTLITRETAVSFNVQPDVIGTAAAAVTIQPQRHSEASLSIGVPLGMNVGKKPGQVMDEKLDYNNHPNNHRHVGTKIVFPGPHNEEPIESQQQQQQQHGQMLKSPQNLESDLVPPREVLKLSSKPMYHQLPSDLTPPPHNLVAQRPRPPWDPRPGHFHSGKPEYVRAPQSPQRNPAIDQVVAFKRIDHLPNILPQFRPNAKNQPPVPPPPQLYLNRQPLLERPSNRPMAFFEKLQPPPPLAVRTPLNLRKNIAQDRIMHSSTGSTGINAEPKMDLYDFYQMSPPNVNVLLPNRRVGNVEAAAEHGGTGDIETLQMIQAKQQNSQNATTTDKPLYVVYPVNTAPIKLDILEPNKKEAVVIGTRAELPLPPSEINQEFNYDTPKKEDDLPILKPQQMVQHHHQQQLPQHKPIRTDFPYPLERPDSASLNSVPVSLGNRLDEPEFQSNNQWNQVTTMDAAEARIVVHHNKNPEQIISATLKTYTEKPIAVAYTPTEPPPQPQPPKSMVLESTINNRYSMPNYGSPVIPEIHQQNAQYYNQHSEIDRIEHSAVGTSQSGTVIGTNDFQAPFQASVNIDGAATNINSANHGWSVVRPVVPDDDATSKSGSSKVEPNEDGVTTTLPVAVTSEFDIENFKPQLEGGFKPIYSVPATEEEEEGGGKKIMEEEHNKVNPERQE